MSKDKGKKLPTKDLKIPENKRDLKANMKAGKMQSVK